MGRGQQRSPREPSDALELGTVSEPAHTRRRSKAALASFTLESQDWEGD